MKFKTTVNEVKKALAVLAPILNYNHPTLAFRHIRISRLENKIEFKAYDEYALGSAFITYYDLEQEEGEEAVAFVLAKSFIGLINSFSSNELTVEVNPDQVLVKCGRSKYKLQTLDEGVASEILDPLSVDYYNLELDFNNVRIDRFQHAYKSVSHCLSKDDSERNLQHIYLHNNKMIACDGIRGAAMNFDTTNIDGMMLHKKACECITNIANASEVSLGVSDNILYGKTEDYIFMTTLPEDYPYDNFRELIEEFSEESTVVLQFDPEEILDKLDRVLMFADTDTNAVLMRIMSDQLNLIVENKSVAEESVNVFDNLSNTNDLNIFVDGKALKECLNKTLSETKWVTEGEDSVQYIYDGSLLQFFMGLDA